MKKHYTVEIASKYVELSFQPDQRPDPAALKECWDDLATACSENNSRLVIARANCPIGGFTVSDIFEMASSLARSIPGMTMALVLQEDGSVELKEFFQLAAFNRGLRIDFFSDYDSALRWLRTLSGDLIGDHAT